MDQPKIERLLNVIKMMTGPVEYSVNELAKNLQTTTRTIYRYVDSFREAGFIVYKSGNAYRLGSESPGLRDLNKVVAFSSEEAALVNDLISGLNDTNALKFSLRKKLATVFAVADLATVTADQQMGANIHELTSAIRSGNCAMLIAYASSNSSVVRDRLVEPFAFTDNYVSIWCYDLEDGACKQFRLSRIGSVSVLPDKWTHSDSHQVPFTDIFRLSSSQKTHVSLRLNLRAKNLLVEEYPQAAKSITPVSNDSFLFESDICGWHGIGRFVLGLLGDVEVVSPPEFRQWLKERLAFSASLLE